MPGQAPRIGFQGRKGHPAPDREGERDEEGFCADDQARYDPLTLSTGLGLTGLHDVADTWWTSIDSALGTTSTVQSDDVEFESDYETSDELVAAHEDLGRRVGQESAVLMKNDGALPLASGARVTLFGMGGMYPFLGGEMGSTITTDDAVDLVSALGEAGFEVNPTMTSIYETLGSYGTETESSVSWVGTTTTYTYRPAGFSTLYVPSEPSLDIYTTEGGADESYTDSFADYGDAAIVVFSRPGSEGSDYYPGDTGIDTEATGATSPLGLCDNERAVLQLAEENFDTVIVLINSGSTMEVDELKNDDNVNAMLYIGFPGAYGTLGVADVLNGTVSPSGHLVDTYAVDTASAPAVMNFGEIRLQDTSMFVWPDTLMEGLEVVNSGSSFGGAASTASDGYLIEAEGIYTGYKYYETRYYDAVVGQGNATSSTGASGGASSWDYDAEVSYPFGHGLSYTTFSETLDSVSLDTDEKTVTTEVVNQLADADVNYYDPGYMTPLSRSDWDGTFPRTYDDLAIGGDKSEEWIQNLMNEVYQITENGEVANVDGSGGTLTLSDLAGNDDPDDPQWDELVEQIPVGELIAKIAMGGSQSDAISEIDSPVVYQNDGPNGFSTTISGRGLHSDDANADYNMATLCSMCAFAGTFNKSLAAEWGRLLGNDGLWSGNYLIWASAANLHRCAYNGRNFEYYSEDPMLSNFFATETVKGALEYGVIVGPKHFAFNDQETLRAGVAPYMTEQRAREGELRAFQGSVEEGGALGMMTSFGRIGATPVNGSWGLLRNILRGEWGFSGLLSTDMNSNAGYFRAEMCIYGGITMIADFSTDETMEEVQETWPYLTEDLVVSDAQLVSYARENMAYQLYAYAQSAVQNIKTESVTPWWETALNGVTYAGFGLAALFGVLYAAGAVKEAKSDKLAAASKEEN